MITRECVHLVTGSYFRLRKKDSAIRSAVGENATLYAHFTAVCVIDADLLAMEFLHCAEVDTRRHPLRVCLLWTFYRTFIYELNPHCLVIHRICKYELPA